MCQFIVGTDDFEINSPDYLRVKEHFIINCADSIGEGLKESSFGLITLEFSISLNNR